VSDALSSILESKEAQRLATGFVFTEGPVWHPDGFYYFVDIRKSHLHKIVPGKEPELVRSNTGEGNGTTLTCRAGSSCARAATGGSRAGTASRARS
jgi:sugar lactone lactonase YvrE